MEHVICHSVGDHLVTKVLSDYGHCLRFTCLFAAVVWIGGALTIPDDSLFNDRTLEDAASEEWGLGALNPLAHPSGGVGLSRAADVQPAWNSHSEA